MVPRETLRQVSRGISDFRHLLLLIAVFSGYYLKAPPNQAANEKNITKIPIARPIPYTGENEAKVPDIDIKPLEADVPTADMLAKTGITTNSTANAMSANSGTMMSPMLELIAPAIFQFTLPF